MISRVRDTDADPLLDAANPETPIVHSSPLFGVAPLFGAAPLVGAVADMGADRAVADLSGVAAHQLNTSA